MDKLNFKKEFKDDSLKVQFDYQELPPLDPDGDDPYINDITCIQRQIEKIYKSDLPTEDKKNMIVELKKCIFDIEKERIKNEINKIEQQIRNFERISLESGVVSMEKVIQNFKDKMNKLQKYLNECNQYK